MTLELIVIVLGCVVAAALLFWQLSTIISVLLGAPAVSSPKSEGWINLADKRKTVIDLGCGAGTVLIRMSPHFKHVYGMEGSPWFYFVSRWRTRNLNNVTVIFGNFFYTAWPKTDFVYCYLLTHMVTKLKPLFKTTDATIMSLSFPIDGWQPSRTVKDNHRTLYIYENAAKHDAVHTRA